MRFYTKQHEYYGGVDLHGHELYLCLLNAEREKLVHRPIKNLRTDIRLKVLSPYLDKDLVLAAESSWGWYWLADFCAEHGIHFVLGHALYMKAIHGGKVKNDKIDSEKIALLLQGGLIPQAYVYPREYRALRDLLRRRLRFVQERAELCGHLQVLNSQSNNKTLKKVKQDKSARKYIADRFEDINIKKSVEMDLSMIEHCDKIISKLEWHIGKHARQAYYKELAILMSVKGVGKTIALTIMLEIGDLERFPTVGQFASYARLVRGSFVSANKKYKSKGKKIGNPYLKRVLSEAAMLVCGFNEDIDRWRKKRERRYGRGKSYAILAHKLGRAFYHMLKQGKAFDKDVFLGRTEEHVEV